VLWKFLYSIHQHMTKLYTVQICEPRVHSRTLCTVCVCVLNVNDEFLYCHTNIAVYFLCFFLFFPFNNWIIIIHASPTMNRICALWWCVVSTYIYNINNILYYVVSCPCRIMGMFIIKICFHRHRADELLFFSFFFCHYFCTVELI